MKKKREKRISKRKERKRKTEKKLCVCVQHHVFMDQNWAQNLRRDLKNKTIDIAHFVCVFVCVCVCVCVCVSALKIKFKANQTHMLDNVRARYSFVAVALCGADDDSFRNLRGSGF